MMAARYAADALRSMAATLLGTAGMSADMARDVATVLVEGDLLGHDTHGLALLAPYLAELESGSLRKAGTYRVLNERAAAALWDGERLPGPWLTLRAIDDAIARAQHCGTGTVVIRRSHHIACLAAYLTRATERGFVLLLTCSDPNSASVAPHGGLKPVFTPDPLAFGVPTSGDPVLIDLSASLTTNGMTRAPAQARAQVRARMAARRQRPRDRRPGRAVHRTQRHDPAGRRRRCRSQGLRARADRRDADRRAGRVSVAPIRRKAGARPLRCTSSIRTRLAVAQPSSVRPTGWWKPAAPTRRALASMPCDCLGSAALRCAASSCSAAWR